MSAGWKERVLNQKSKLSDEKTTIQQNFPSQKAAKCAKGHKNEVAPKV